MDDFFCGNSEYVHQSTPKQKDKCQPSGFAPAKRHLPKSDGFRGLPPFKKW